MRTSLDEVALALADIIESAKIVSDTTKAVPSVTWPTVDPNALRGLRESAERADKVLSEHYYEK